MTMLPTIREVVSAVVPELFHREATLHVRGETAFVPGTGETISWTDYELDKACFLDSTQIGLRGAGLIEAEEVAVTFYVGRLPAGVVLESDDEVTVKDEIHPTGKRFKLVRLAAEDPAAATQTWAAVAS